MNQLIVSKNIASMSSLEIAKLTGKEHSHVMRDIRNMLLELNGDTSGLSRFGSSYMNSQNKEQPCFELPKEETLCLMSGYDVRARMVIIKRWQELELFQQPKELSRKDLALMVIDAENEIERLGVIVERQKPAVEFVERYVEAKSSKCLSDVAKILKFKPREFIQMLYADGVIFKRSGVWIPYQQHIDAGRFTVHPGVSAGHAYDQTRVEPEGVVWLARRYAMAVAA